MWFGILTETSLSLSLSTLTGPGRYVPFGTLSGGQQALAALALSLAISSVFPCALAIYDEIDANVCTSVSTERIILVDPFRRYETQLD